MLGMAVRTVNRCGALAILASALGLSGCATGPGRSQIAASGSRFFDRIPVCITIPAALREKRVGPDFFIDADQRAVLAPFLEANLFRLVAHGTTQQDDSRIWFEASDDGNQRLIECPVDANNPSGAYSVGFRIGTRHLVRTHPAAPISQDPCLGTKSIAVVRYQVQIDLPEFDFDRFHTNFAHRGFDRASRQGNAVLAFTKAGRSWAQSDLVSAHLSNLQCERLK